MKLSIAILPDLAKQTAETVVQMNVPVLCSAIGVTLFGGVQFGCAPAWHAVRLNLSDTLKQGSRSVSGYGRMRTQAVLVTAEFALAITLLAGAGMALHWQIRSPHRSGMDSAVASSTGPSIVARRAEPACERLRSCSPQHVA